MPFGKRSAAAAKALEITAVAPEPVEPQPTRLVQLRDQMARLLSEAQRIADAIRDEGAVAMPVIVDEPDPEAGPLPVKGLHVHFFDGVGADVRHVVYAYADPDDRRAVDLNAQYHLSLLTGHALAFNAYCQRAQMDEALGVALQSPEVPAAIDAILVRSAYFAAFFENMIAMQQAAGSASRDPDLSRHRATLDRYLLMAIDKMIRPKTAESLLPPQAWPFVGVEVPVVPHDGDHFINGVYFPANEARRLLAAKGHTGDRLPAVA